MSKTGSTAQGVKRAFDVFVSLFVFVGFWWVFVLLAILVKVNLGSPVLFRQSRPGKDGRLFTLVKFRTMRNATSFDGRVLPDKERVTRFGSWLRSTSLDELPEFWNVLKGEMSLVGPRPLLPEYLERYSAEQARRHEVRPGITGWAQVNGRNTVGWDERFKMDVWYVENRNFGLDLRILWMTFVAVFRRTGVSANGHVTMTEFLGSERSDTREGS